MSFARRCLAASILATAASIALLARPAGAEELIVVPPAFTITLPAQLPATVPVPFTAGADATAAELEVEVVAVSREGIHAPADVQAELDPSVRLLVLTFAGSGFDRAGAYAITLQLRSGGASQLLDIAVTRDSAGLTTPSVVKVTRTVGVPEIDFLDSLLGLVPGVDTDELEKPALTVAVDADSRLASLAAFQTGAEIGTVVISGPCGSSSCELSGAEPRELVPPVEPNGSVDLRYSLDGDFPLGASSRTVELRSPHLAETRQITFEVTSRRTLALIPLLAAIGLLVGFLLRQAITWLLARLGGGEENRDLIETLVAVRERVEDSDFRREMDSIVEQAERLGADDNDERQHLTSEAQTLLAGHEQELEELRDGYDELHPILSVPRLAPDGVSGALKGMQDALLRLSNRLSVYDARGAREANADVDTGESVLASQSNSWLGSYHHALDILITAADTVSAHDVRREAEAASRALPSELPEELKDRLDALHSVMLTWEPVAAAIADLAAGTPDPIAGSRLRSVLEQGSDPAETAEAIEPILAAMDDNAVLGVTAKNGAEAALAEPTGAEPEEVRLPKFRPPRELSLKHLPARAANAFLRFMLQLTRFVLLWIGFTLLAFAVFSGGWTGDAKDLLTVLFWAFGTDISVQALTTLSSTSLPAPKPRG